MHTLKRASARFFTTTNYRDQFLLKTEVGDSEVLRQALDRAMSLEVP